MRKITIIALLPFVMCTSCDWYCVSPSSEEFIPVYLYKYNTGEQYINNVKLKLDGIDTLLISNKFIIGYYHNGYMSRWGLDVPDTSNIFVLSITYDALDTMNDGWKAHFRDYVIANIWISEIYTTNFCFCHKRPCFYENYPFIFMAKDRTFHFDPTKTNQMIDDKTIWKYFERII